MVLHLALWLVMASGTPQPELPRLVLQVGHSAPVRLLAFSPDGRWLLSAGADRSAIVWDFGRGRQIRRIVVDDSPRAIGFSPDGSRVFAPTDGRIGVWDPLAGDGPVCRVERETSAANPPGAAAYTADGACIVEVTADHSARVYNATDGKLISKFRPDVDAASVGAVPPNHEMLVAGSSSILGYDAGSSAVTRRIATDEQHPCIAVDAGGRRAIAWDPESIEVLDLGSRTRIRKVQPSRGADGRPISFVAAAISSDGASLAAVDSSGAVSLWQADAGTLLWQRRITTAPTCLAFSPAGTHLVVGCRDGDVVSFDAARVGPGRALGERPVPVTSLAVATDEPSIVVGGGAAAALWSLRTGTPVPVRGIPVGVIGSIGVTSDAGLICAGTNEFASAVIDAASGARLLDRQGGVIPSDDSAPDWAASISPDGRYLPTGNWEGQVQVTDLHTRRVADTLGLSGQLGSARRIAAMAFSRDGSRLLAATRDAVELHDVARRSSASIPIADGGRVRAAALADSGTRVAVATQDSVCVRVADTGRPLAEERVAACSVAFSPGGDRLAIGCDDGDIVVIRCDTGARVARCRGHVGAVQCLGYLPMAERLVSGGADRTARVWDSASGAELCRMLTLPNAAWVVVDPSGRYDASNGGDTDVLAWIAGSRVVDLRQMERLYYHPGLLARCLGYASEPLRQVTAIASLPPAPTVTISAGPADADPVAVTVVDNGGGIGPVHVVVNGVQVSDDVGVGAKVEAGRMRLALDLGRYARFMPSGASSQIEVVAETADGSLESPRSRGVTCSRPAAAGTDRIDLWTIVVGTSDYAGAAIDLNFAAWDAEEIAKALDLAGSNELFAARHAAVLTTLRTDPSSRPTKANIRAAFEQVIALARPRDVIVVFMAGHGVAFRQGTGSVYCYLTGDASSVDPAPLAEDAALRERAAVTGEEIARWMQECPANKRVLILDTCAAGAAMAAVVPRGATEEQRRALVRLRDAAGFWMLMGCAADMASYETSRFSHGYVTYALLEGLQGALPLPIDNSIGVGALLSYAADRVPRLSWGSAGVQRPEIGVPIGSEPFEIGRLTPADRRKIALKVSLPVVGRPQFMDQAHPGDPLKMVSLVTRRLRQESTATADAPPRLVFVDANDLPDGIALSGAYTVVGDTVTVKVAALRGGRSLLSADVQGRTDDLDGLAARIVALIEVRTAEEDKHESHMAPTSS